MTLSDINVDNNEIEDVDVDDVVVAVVAVTVPLKLFDLLESLFVLFCMT